MTVPLDLSINPAAYVWSMRAIHAVERHLGLKVRLHDEDDLLTKGQIFLFNHFARFETIIPPYLAYSRTGMFTRSVADHDLFTTSSTFSRYLTGVGAVPNDMPNLLAFLAAEIFRGRKVVFFPEGGMVKDRKVMDQNGEFGVFSRSARRRRHHHRGAAVLALVLDLFKTHLRDLAADGNFARLDHWQHHLNLDSREALLTAAGQPTLIVPGNITFHPLRGTDSALRKAVDLFSREMPQHYSEELLVESTILFRDTDMDIRLEQAIAPETDIWWWERSALQKRLAEADGLEDLFTLQRSTDGSGIADRLLMAHLARQTSALRDRAAAALYHAITINIGHVAARLIVALVERNRLKVSLTEFWTLLYAALKALQHMQDVHLHPGLSDPERYAPLPDARNADLTIFLDTAKAAGLLVEQGDALLITDTLCLEYAFDEIRLTNPIMVLDNECAPVWQVREAVAQALWAAPLATPASVVANLIEDERLTLTAQRNRFLHSAAEADRFAQINDRETATADAMPFLLQPPEDIRKPVGVLLIHGFLASPAEMRSLGEALCAAGHVVYGLRLPGHGTSPWDLRTRNWTEWMAATRRGASILRRLTPQMVAIGFSTGGALALAWAAEHPDGLIGVSAIAPPLVFRSRAMSLVPLVEGLNRVAAWGMLEDGIIPFRDNEPEHPEVNYRSVPVRTLQELRGLIAEVVRRLPQIGCPVFLIQSDNDPVVHPKSAEKVMARLSTRHKRLETIASNRHGIVYENIGGCHDMLVAFVEELSVAPPDRLLPPPR